MLHAGGRPLLSMTENGIENSTLLIQVSGLIKMEPEHLNFCRPAFEATLH